MREVDDAHDAEHEVQAEADEGVVKAENEPGDDGADQHGGTDLAVPLTRHGPACPGHPFRHVTLQVARTGRPMTRCKR